MKRVFAGPWAWFIGLTGCLAVGALGAWALWPQSQSAAGSDSAVPGETTARTAEILRAIPRPKGKATVDRAIVSRAERVRRKPGSADGWAELGEALMQKARDTADSSYYGHAAKAFGRALALSPRHGAATTGMAWVHSCRHEFEKSIDWANKAIAQDPRDYAAYGLLGDAAVEMGDYEAAFEHYQQMLDLHPDLSSYSRGAHLLYLRGDVRKAAWLMGKAIAAGAPYAENTAWCRAQLALMHFSTGHLLAAEQLVQEGLGKTPNNYHLLVASAKVKTARQDYPAAIASLKKAVAIAPHHEALVALGDLYRLTGNRAEAGKQYDLVEAIHRINKANGVRGDSQLAQFYADHDRNLGQALKMVEEEYKTRKNVFVADILAWCYYKNGRYKEALRFSSKALNQRTPDALLLFHAGMIHAKRGERRLAQQYLNQALALNPYFSPLYAPVAVDTLNELGARPPR